MPAVTDQFWRRYQRSSSNVSPHVTVTWVSHDVFITAVCYQGLDEGAERIIKCITAEPSQWLDMQYFHQDKGDQLMRVSNTARYCNFTWKLWSFKNGSFCFYFCFLCFASTASQPSYAIFYFDGRFTYRTASLIRTYICWKSKISFAHFIVRLHSSCVCVSHENCVV